MDERRLAGFTSVKILTECSLGTGAYGSVCKAKCDDLTCAAKVLHLLAIPDKDGSYAKSMEEEIAYLTSICHPNLIQYLGSLKDEATNLPVLLMELMDESLTQFLEKCQEETPPPFHVQVNICHDVALALSFLHCNHIIHRNLSSNNVLMIADRRAKVTDFGMARLSDINRQHAQGSLSKHQGGGDPYMPPEAASGSCSPKIDCFSFGVLALQVLTQKSPQPGDQFKIVQINDPNFPDGIETRATEADRRQNHIDLVAADDLLLAVALTCIRDKEDERPSSHDLCEQLTDIKEKDQYSDSVTNSNTDRIMDDIEKQVLGIQKLSTEEVDGPPPATSQTAENGAADVEALQQQIEKMRENELATNQELDSLKGEIKSAKIELEEKDSHLQAQVLKYEKKVKELEQRLQLSQQTVTSFSEEMGPMELKKIRLEWQEKFRAPCGMSRTSDGVVTTGKVLYVRPGGTREIYCYNITISRWSRLPDLPVKECGIAIVKRKLTVIGGQKQDQAYTSKLLSLVETAGKMEWIVIYPPMPTRRASAIILQCRDSLIVAGGENSDGYLQTTEVLNASTQTWQAVADLPEPLTYASASCSGSNLYLLGGWVEKMTPIYSLRTTTLESLLASSPPEDAAGLGGGADADPSPSSSPWKELTHLPLKGSTSVCVKGRLLAIGGRDIHKPTSAIHAYNPLSNSWELLGHLNLARHQCFAAVLDGKLLVVGGYKLNNKQVLTETTLVEMAKIL